MTGVNIAEAVSLGIEREQEVARAEHKFRRRNAKAEKSRRNLEIVSREQIGAHNTQIRGAVDSAVFHSHLGAARSIGEITALTTLSMGFAGEQAEQYKQLFQNASQLGESVLILGNASLVPVPRDKSIVDVTEDVGFVSRIISGKLQYSNPDEIKITPDTEYHYPVQKQIPRITIGMLDELAVDPIDSRRGKGVNPHTTVAVRGGRFAVRMAVDTPIISDSEIVYDFLNHAVSMGELEAHEIPSVFVTGQAPIGEALKWLYRNRSSDTLSDLDILAMGALQDIPSSVIADGDVSRHWLDMTTRAERKILDRIYNGGESSALSGFSTLRNSPKAVIDETVISTSPVDVEAYLRVCRPYDIDAADFTKEIQATTEKGILDLVDELTGEKFTEEINRPLREYVSNIREFMESEGLGDIPNVSRIMAKAYEKVLAKVQKGEIQVSRKTQKSIRAQLVEYIAYL